MPTRLLRRTAPGLLFWASTATLAYVHLGYPIALGILTRRRATASPPVDSAGGSSRATFIISALDEETGIGPKIEQTLALDTGGRQVDVVVVADGSTDGTATVARSFDDARLTVLHEPQRRGKAAAINRGVEAASGDVLVFSDANNEWRADALDALLETFDDLEVGGATGQKTVLPSTAQHAQSEGWYSRYESWIRARESELGSCTAANGEIMAIRRECFDPIPEETVVDDLHLALAVIRRGRRFVAVPGAVSIEPSTPSESDEWERRARMAAGRAALMSRRSTFVGLPPLVIWQVVSHKVGRLAVPVAAVAALIGACAAVRWSPTRATRAIARTALIGYGVLGVVAATSPQLSDRTPAPVRSAARCVRYLLISDAAVGAGLVRAARKRQSSSWTRVARPPSTQEWAA